MRLRKFIEVLEGLPPMLPVGLGRAISWRGVYAELAFEPKAGATAGDVLKEARAAVGSTFEGYKGGEYVMDEDTLCHVDAYGDSGGPTLGEYMTILLAQWLAEVV